MHLSPALALGLSAAGCWGLSGFVGGLAARRVGALTVAAGTQLAGFLVAIVALAVTQPPLPHVGSLLPPLAGGLAGGLGLAALFRAMSLGQMGLRGLALAILAAGLFGLFYLGLAASAEQNVLWTVAAARVLSVALLLVLAAIAWSARPRPRGGVTGRIAVSGTLDVTGNAVFAAAATQGPVVQAAVPAALYPLVTLLLARALLSEGLQRGRRARAALALTGLALMAVPT